MPSTIPALVLAQNGEIKSGKITIAKEDSGCQLADIQKYLKKKSPAQLLGTYSWKSQTLHLLGYKEGKAGTENQHELPPPCDKELYFGDIVLLLSKDKKSFAHPISMKTEEYEAFYTQMFEGFESLGESDSEDDEDEFEEEEGEEDVDVGEGEFEENEEQGEYSDDDDEHEVLEEFEGNKKEEEDEEVLPVLPKKKATKVTKGKGKAQKEAAVTVIPTITTELKTEETINTSPPSQETRAKIFSVLERLAGSLFRREELIELEHHIYNTSLLVASKKHISKSWNQMIFVEVYTSLARSVLGNITPDSYIRNKGLYERYRNGRITLEELASYTYSDLYPEIWKELSIRQFEREKRQLEGNKSMATDQFECKRCHKRECTYYELQTRSADEPMTIFIQCVNCGKHWRQ